MSVRLSVMQSMLSLMRLRSAYVLSYDTTRYETRSWHTRTHARTHAHTHTHTHTRLKALFPGLSRWASTRKVEPIWILLKQETVSGSGISWARCKSAPCSRQITTPAPHHSVFTGQLPFLPPNQQRQSTEGTKLIKSAQSTVLHRVKYIYKNQPSHQAGMKNITIFSKKNIWYLFLWQNLSQMT